MKILSVLIGVVIGVVLSDQSEPTEIDDEPITSQESVGKRRNVETPQVVLQIKYDRGELNRIYLAQFRKGKNNNFPSVATRESLCTDLCHAGLGGHACGPTCINLTPVGLHMALTNGTDDEVTYGTPRVQVCPTLCQNTLGEPLCGCSHEDSEEDDVHWNDICHAFCLSDNYVLNGCPACSADTAVAPYAARTLNTADGWAAWCNAQCRQGHGGAACNCDRAPM